MSILKKRIFFIFAFLFMAMTLAACTGDTVRVVIVNGENQMFVGDEQTLTATVRPISFDQTVIWSTSDSTIATVDKNGLVRALKPGTVTLKQRQKQTLM